MKTEDKGKVIQVLQLIVEEGQKEGFMSGLCSHIKSAFRYNRSKGNEVVQYLQEKVWPKWPEHSGNRLYPVPHDEYDDPEKAFILNLGLLYVGEYGAARLRLAQFTIDYLSTPWWKRLLWRFL